MTDDRIAYLRRLVRHRCPELTDDDLDELADDSVAGTWAGIIDMVLASFDELEARLDAIEQSLRRPH